MVVKNFLGRGWKFPVGVDRDGGLATSAYEQNIEEAIEIILGTAPGERVMRPDFGCAIHDLVFAPNNAETASKSAYLVGEALQSWEPRIQGVEVDAAADTFEDNRLNIKIRYEVRATNSIFNMVYPFYLRKEDEGA